MGPRQRFELTLSKDHLVRHWSGREEHQRSFRGFYCENLLNLCYEWFVEISRPNSCETMIPVPPPSSISSTLWGSSESPLLEERLLT